MKGNHDLELHWHLVQRALRMLVAREGADQANVQRSLVFCETWTQIDNVYLEHGHLYEPMTAVTGPPRLESPSDELNLPPGSFVNRYLINPLERSEPFLDNRKPVNAMLKAFIQRHPVRALQMLAHARRFLFRAVKSRRLLDSAGIVLLLLSLVLPILTLLVIVAAVASRWDWLHALLARLGGWKIPAAAVGMLAPYVVGALQDLIAALRERLASKKATAGEDPFGRALAGSLPERLTVIPGVSRYIALLGHTHEQDVQELRLGKGLVMYINTGTWVPLWLDDRPDLLGRTLHPLVELTRDPNGHYSPRYWEWTDSRMAPDEAVILRRAGGKA